MRPLNPSLDRRLTRYPSRKGVADAALAALQPFSAKELMQHLRQSGQVASKATVYRTLALMVENRLLKESTVPRGDLIYYPLAEHDGITWICTECGSTRRQPVSHLEGLLRQSAGQHGFHSSHLEVHVFTRCETSNCATLRVADLKRIWPG